MFAITFDDGTRTRTYARWANIDASVRRLEATHGEYYGKVLRATEIVVE